MATGLSTPLSIAARRLLKSLLSVADVVSGLFIAMARFICTLEGALCRGLRRSFCRKRGTPTFDGLSKFVSDINLLNSEYQPT